MNDLRFMITKEIPTKDYLTASKIGSYCINPYVGCPHACKYCYASFMKRFTNHPEPWGEFVDVKISDKPISLKKISGKNVIMSTVTDPYNALEAKYEITRGILKRLVESDCHLQIITKSKLVLRDLDLLRQMKHLTVAVSINTTDEQFRRDMDRGSSIADRMMTLRTLHENGISNILFMSPIFPLITDWKEIILQTRDYVDHYWLEDLNLRGGYKKEILDYVRAKYPQFYDSYLQIYSKGNRMELLAEDSEIVSWCNKNNIPFTDYFHHEEVIGDFKGKIFTENKIQQ